MTELALVESKVTHLEKENEQYKTLITQWSGKIRAQEQTIDELMKANVNLRAAQILQGDQVSSLDSERNMFIARIKDLEKSIAELNEIIASLNRKHNKLKKRLESTEVQDGAAIAEEDMEDAA